MSKTYQPDSLHPYIMDARLKKATGSGGISSIPIASAETLGGIKVPADSGITIDGSGNAYVPKPVNYSTDEVDTLLLWVDGKKIYRKVIDVGALPNSTTKQVAHGITYDTVISLSGICSNSDNVYLPLPAVATASQYAIELSIDVTNVVITTAQDRSAFSGYVVVEYTKDTE